MAERSPQCSFPRVAGIHYPMVYRSGPFSTPKESQLQLCDGEEPKNLMFYQEEWMLLNRHRVANKQVVVTNFDRCFLEELLDMSRSAGRELAIFYDHEERHVGISLGEPGNTTALDAFRFLTMFHTHPRADDESVPMTMHALNDLVSAYVYASAHVTAVSVVAGKICGGEMELSIVAVEKDNIYVANSFERDLVLLLLPQLMEKIGKPPITPKVIVDTDRIAVLSKQFLFPSSLTDFVRNSFQRFITEGSRE